jgi:hypothetical protein
VPKWCTTKKSTNGVAAWVGYRIAKNSVEAGQVAFGVRVFWGLNGGDELSDLADLLWGESGDRALEVSFGKHGVWVGGWMTELFPV